jgi:hypothetical protein
MHWPDKIRSPEKLAPPLVDIDDSEVAAPARSWMP